MRPLLKRAGRTRAPANSVVFVTGTDTGVGKTIVTALLLCHLRQCGVHALAMKPFATGTPADARLLDRLQEGALPMDRLSPFRFRAPLAPLVAARQEETAVTLCAALDAIRATTASSRVLLVEGCGGLLTPLGPGYSARELLAELQCPVVVCARNRIGALNQVLLTLDALRQNHTPARAVVLTGMRRPDRSASSNAPTLAELAAPTPIITLPWLGARVSSWRALSVAARRVGSLLACLRSCLVPDV